MVSRSEYLLEYYAVDVLTYSGYKGSTDYLEKYLKERITDKLIAVRKQLITDHKGIEDPYPLISIDTTQSASRDGAVEAIMKAIVGAIKDQKIRLFQDPNDVDGSVSVMGLLIGDLAISGRNMKDKWLTVQKRIKQLTNNLPLQEKHSQYSAANRYLSELGSKLNFAFDGLDDGTGGGGGPGKSKTSKGGENLDDLGPKVVNSENEINTDLDLYKIGNDYFIKNDRVIYSIHVYTQAEMSELKDLLYHYKSDKLQIRLVRGEFAKLRRIAQDNIDQLAETLQKRDNLSNNLNEFEISWTPSKTAKYNDDILKALEETRLSSAEGVRDAVRIATNGEFFKGKVEDSFGTGIKEEEEIHIEDLDLSNGIDHIDFMLKNDSFGVNGAIQAFSKQT